MKSFGPVHKLKGYGTGNIYIIEGHELTLVDTGVPLDYRLIVKRIEGLGRSPEDIGNIMLTHFHVDHAGSAAALKGLSGARVYSHEEEAPILGGGIEVKSVYKKGVLGRALALSPRIAERATAVPPVEVDGPMGDGDRIPVLGGVEVIHSPGHTPGSACYYWREAGILFSGDTIINSYHFLTLPTVGFSCDYEKAADSVRRVAEFVRGEDLKVLCPGHGPEVRDRPREKILRLADRLE